MGLLIWKQYAQKNDFNLKESDQGEEEISFEEITPEIIFKSFETTS